MARKQHDANASAGTSPGIGVGPVSRSFPLAGFPSRGARCLIGVLATCLAAGCGDDAVEPVPPQPAVPTAITISPASATLGSLGETVQLAATVQDQNGQAMSGATVAWASGDPLVASVDALGLVAAVGNGTGTITATSGGASGSATVTVAQAAVKLEVAPDSIDALLPGDTLRLSAEATDANGHAIADAAFDWSSSDTLVATVDTAALVRAVGPGTATVTAMADGAAGSTEIYVQSSVTVFFARDAVRVVEGEAAEISIRYEVRELAAAVRLELIARETEAVADDYELDPPTVEIPAGQGISGALPVWLRAVRDRPISEGEEALSLGFQVAEGLSLDLGPDLEIAIVEGGASPCVGVNVLAEPPEPLADAPPWTIPTALFGEAPIIATTLDMEFHPDAEQTLFDWVGPYRNAPQEGESGNSRWWRNRWHSVPEFSVASWEVEQVGLATRHSIRAEWPADTEAVLRFRSTGGGCEGEPRVVCGEDGCMLVPSGGR